MRCSNFQWLEVVQGQEPILSRSWSPNFVQSLYDKAVLDSIESVANKVARVLEASLYLHATWKFAFDYRTMWGVWC